MKKILFITCCLLATFLYTNVNAITETDLASALSSFKKYQTSFNYTMGNGVVNYEITSDNEIYTSKFTYDLTTNTLVNEKVIDSTMTYDNFGVITADTFLSYVIYAKALGVPFSDSMLYLAFAGVDDKLSYKEDLLEKTSYRLIDGETSETNEDNADGGYIYFTEDEFGKYAVKIYQELLVPDEINTSDEYDEDGNAYYDTYYLNIKLVEENGTYKLVSTLTLNDDKLSKLKEIFDTLPDVTSDNATYKIKIYQGQKLIIKLNTSPKEEIFHLEGLELDTYDYDNNQYTLIGSEDAVSKMLFGFSEDEIYTIYVDTVEPGDDADLSDYVLTINAININDDDIYGFDYIDDSSETSSTSTSSNSKDSPTTGAFIPYIAIVAVGLGAIYFYNLRKEKSAFLKYR